MPTEPMLREVEMPELLVVEGGISLWGIWICLLYGCKVA
jgi:hypothetical protein